MGLRKKYTVSTSGPHKSRTSSNKQAVVNLNSLHDKIPNLQSKEKTEASSRAAEKDPHDQVSCGLFGWRPRAFQCFARSLWTFAGFFGLSGMCLAASGFYLRSQLISMERHLRVSSGQMGVLMAANDIGSVVVVLVASHFGKLAHIPRLLATLTLLAGLFVAAIALVQVVDPVTLPTVVTSSSPIPGNEGNGSNAPANPVEAMLMNPLLLCLDADVMRALVMSGALGDMGGTGSSAGAGGMGGVGVPGMDPSSMAMPALTGRHATNVTIPQFMAMRMEPNSAGDDHSGSVSGAAGVGMMGHLPGSMNGSAMQGGGTDMSALLGMMDMMGGQQEQSVHWGYYYTFVALLIVGALGSPRIPLQIFYVETNVEDQTESGVKIGLLTTAMMFGNPLSLLVGSVISTVPIDLKATEMSFLDSRWIGAWWLGFVIFGAGTVLFTLPVFCLPRRIRSSDEVKRIEAAKERRTSRIEETLYAREEAELNRNGSPRRPSNAGPYLHRQTPRPSNASEISRFNLNAHLGYEAIKDFLRSTRHVLANPVVLLVLFNSFTMMLGLSGTMSFQLKYIENQFDVPVYNIALYLGIGMLLTVLIGTFLGGLITTRLRLGLMGMFRMTLGGMVLALGCSIAFIFIGCDNHLVVGFNQELGNASTGGCMCFDQVMLVVCGEDGRNYLSPCLAGCTESDGLTFSKCTNIGGQGTALPGFCSNCDLFAPFMATVTLMALLLLVSLTPHTLMIARLVPLSEQPIVTSLTTMIITIGMLVGPIIFGYIYDSTCALWPPLGGPCVIPDKAALRNTFLGSDAGIRAVGVVALIIAMMILHCKKDTLYQDTEIEQGVIATSFNQKKRFSLVSSLSGAAEENGKAGKGRGRDVKAARRASDAVGKIRRKSLGDITGMASNGEMGSRRVPHVRGIFDGRPVSRLSGMTLPSVDSGYGKNDSGYFYDDVRADEVYCEPDVLEENMGIPGGFGDVHDGGREKYTSFTNATPETNEIGIDVIGSGSTEKTITSASGGQENKAYVPESLDDDTYVNMSDSKIRRDGQQKEDKQDGCSGDTCGGGGAGTRGGVSEEDICDMFDVADDVC